MVTASSQVPLQVEHGPRIRSQVPLQVEHPDRVQARVLDYVLDYSLLLSLVHYGLDLMP
jgi:hypothetical protein